MKDCIVLGAGMVGVGTALALQRLGVAVTLADRRPAGEETSYGNAGIIQMEAVEPYPFPRQAGEILSAALGFNDKVRWRAGSLHRWAGPVLRYFLASAPASHRRIAAVYSAMIRQAGEDHAPLIEAAGAGDLIRRDGFRDVYRRPRSFDQAVHEAERLRREFGVAARIETGQDLAQAEPTLRIGLAGAVHWTDAWSCADPGALTAAYARLFSARGGTTVTADATTLRQTAGGWRIDGPDGPIEAEHVVVALGPWSAELLRPLGYRIPMFFKRGYHQHFTGGRGPDLPLIDADRGIVVAPMRKGLRVLTGAELTDLTAGATRHQIDRARMAAGELFDLGTPVESEAWFGNRPCLPGMLPIVGRAPRHKGLWLNFGHGHQGFTLGPTTGRMLAGELAGNERVPGELGLGGEG
ncbi:FAD-dependent oxidoreductase (plasmid) [Tistrella mobilis]|uniref:NAD(P)/FAD-dependent oxidoreductase n=1 Tax=Tistrella mobilis TaxID=171437 RepID=UPI00355687CD